MEMSQGFIQAFNKVANEVLGNKGKGTSYWYYAGTIGNKSACYTRAKTHYKGKFGFWSWIQTKYKNKKIKRTKFAKSATKAKAEARANRLLEQIRKEVSN